MQNFNWWVNRKDPQGQNVFAGGFLGLDNIGVFDRSAPLPTGGHLDQADGTAWMAFYCQNMLEIALILTEYDSMYEEIAFRFLEHFVWITYAMDRIGENHDEMWDTQEGFFYDLLHFPNGDAARLKVRSMVGLLPLCASTVFEAAGSASHPRMLELIELFRKRHPDVLKQIAPADGKFNGYAGRGCCRSATRRKSSGSWPTCSMRTSSSVPMEYGLCPDITLSIRSCSISMGRNTKSNTCRRSRTPECSAATPTGAGRFGCR